MSMSVEARRARVAELHRDGLAVSEIATELGVSWDTARSDVAALGLALRPAPRSRVSAARRERARELAETGASAGEIAQELGVSVGRVYELLPDEGPAGDEWLTLAAAAAETGLSREALRGAIQHDRLPATFSRRARRPSKRGSRTHWLIAPSDLGDFVESLPTCAYPGCRRPGHSATGCCSGPHAIGVLTRGRRRDAAFGAKISAKMRGVARGPRSSSWRKAITLGLERFYRTATGDHVRRLSSDRVRESYAIGGSFARAAIELPHVGPSARRIHKGRWAVQRRTKHAGRPRFALTSEQRVLVAELQRRGWGERPIATRLGIARETLRRVLAE